MASLQSTCLRGEAELYPDFSAEIAAIRAAGRVTERILRRIVEKHAPNAAFNRGLHRRYLGVDVPVYRRGPRFEADAGALNNRVNNDFFGEITDFFAGYFAGKPIGYSYANTPESIEVTGGEAAVREAGRAVSDFVARNNMMDVDMECTKYASVCGYAARLFYHDADGCERVAPVPPFEAAILSEVDISEPFAAVRYFPVLDLDGRESWRAEYYDASGVVYFAGADVEHLAKTGERLHLYDMCPLQGIPKNGEMTGDAEKVLLAIDAYDRALSDAANDSEAFANAYMVFENVNMSDEDIRRGQRAGAFQYFNGGAGGGSIRFLTKDVNDAFLEHHLDRLERNIYRFSRTPNLTEEHFCQNSSGVAMKFKMTGVETKCGVFQAKMQGAGMYMFRLLAGSWAKKRVRVEPLQCVMDFHRNFPLDLEGEARAVGALVDAGVPERVAFAQLSFVDDVDWVLQVGDGGEGEA